MAALALLLAYSLSWLGALVNSVRHAPRLPAQQRILDMLAPGSVEWAVVVLLAVALVVVAPGAVPRPQVREGLPRTLLLAASAVASASVGLAALLAMLVEVANFGNGIDAAVAGIVARAATVPIAAVTAWWAVHAMGERD